MQFVQLKQNTSLTQFRNLVGTSNVENILAVNSLDRTPSIGQQLYDRQAQAIHSDVVSNEYKISALSRASGDSDVFEAMSLMGDSGWKILNITDTLPGTVKIPDGISISQSENVIGNSQRVPKLIYKKVIKSIKDPPHYIDPDIFADSYRGPGSQIINAVAANSDNLFQFFKIPWGNMTIYSSLANESKDFPVYPEEMSDAVRANYTTMPDLIYQYEPWQLFTSSGPRTNTYTFTFHRDMWTGDHRDGKANELVRFCMANCYPEYNGSAVNTSLVSLYMNGQLLIRGVLTDVSTNWDGPLAMDGFYLVCKLQLTIIEVSPYPLDYWTVKNKPLIG